MSGGDGQLLKMISVEGRKEPTIQVSSGNSLIDYIASHFKEVTYVRTPTDCFPAERQMIIHSCNQFPFLVYESGDDSGDGGDSEKKNEEREKEGDKTRSCCCN